MSPTLPSNVLSKATFKRVASNTGWLVGDRVIRMGLNFLLVAWMARYLGTEAFGQYNYLLAFVALFSGFATFGVDAIAVRDLLNAPAQRDAILGTAALLKLAGGAVANLGLLVAFALVSPSLWPLAAIAGIALVSQAFDVVDAWFQSRSDLKYPVYARNLAFALVAIVRIWLIVHEAPLVHFIWAAALEGVLAGLFMLTLLWRNGPPLRSWTWSSTRARQMMRDAMPMLVSGIAIMLYMRIDQVMIAKLASFEQVGIFSAAVRLTEVWYFVPMALMTALFPSMMKSKAQNDDALHQRRTLWLFGLMGWAALAIALLTSTFAPWLVRLFYGSAYDAAAPILAIQAWMAVFVFFGVARGRWLLADNRQRDSMLVDLIGVVLNVALNLVLIPRHGAMGAAVASLLTAAGANLVVASFSDPIRRSLAMYAAGIVLPLRKAGAYWLERRQ